MAKHVSGPGFLSPLRADRELVMISGIMTDASIQDIDYDVFEALTDNCNAESHCRRPSHAICHLSARPALDA